MLGRSTHRPAPGRFPAPAIVLVALLLAPSNCPADQSTTSPTAAEQAAACETAFRAAWRGDEEDPPVPWQCRRIDRATQKQIARKVIFDEVPTCPTEKFPDCEGIEP